MGGAMRIELGGDKVKRAEIFKIRPSAIKVDWAANSRADQVTDEAVAVMAADIKANGQIQPITARRLPDMSPMVVAGYTRLKAGLLIEREDPEFLLDVRVANLNDEEAFLLSIRENMIRNDRTPIDDATNARRLIENYGYDRQRVADLYRCSTSRVADLLRLLTLPASVRSRVSAGTLNLTDALRLGKVDEAEVPKVLDQLDAGEATVATAVRSRGVKVGRTSADLKRLLVGRPDELSVTLLAFFAGTATDDDVLAAIDAVTVPQLDDDDVLAAAEAI